MMRWTFSALELFLGSVAIDIAQDQASDETAAASAKPRSMRSSPPSASS